MWRRRSPKNSISQAGGRSNSFAIIFTKKTACCSPWLRASYPRSETRVCSCKWRRFTGRGLRQPCLERVTTPRCAPNQARRASDHSPAIYRWERRQEDRASPARGEPSRRAVGTIELVAFLRTIGSRATKGSVVPPGLTSELPSGSQPCRGGRAIFGRPKRLLRAGVVTWTLEPLKQPPTRLPGVALRDLTQRVWVVPAELKTVMKIQGLGMVPRLL